MNKEIDCLRAAKLSRLLYKFKDNTKSKCESAQRAVSATRIMPVHGVLGGVVDGTIVADSTEVNVNRPS